MQSTIDTLILVTDLVGLAVGVQVFWGSKRARKAEPGRDVLRLVLLGGVLGVATGVMVRLTVANGFATLRLWCHVLFCVLAPLMIARGVHQLLRRPRRTAFAAFLIVAAVLMEGTYVYARRVEPYRLQVRRHVIETDRLRTADGPVRVVVLADLQTDRVTDWERSVFRAIDEERADLILVPGDLVQLPPRSPECEDQLARVAQLFRGLRHEPRFGIYMVDGDVDEPGRGLRGTAVRLLRNERVRLPEESRLQIVGMTLSSSRRPLRNADLEAVDTFPGLTIFMGHAPDFAASMIDGGLTAQCLLVAGHTHGGQVVVPGLGAPMTLSRLPRRFAGGLHRIGDAWLLVSRGIGLERGYAPRIRLFCPPELVVLELRPATEG